MWKRPWNWCYKCGQTVDIDNDDFDGSEVKCWGCGRRFVLAEMTDGSFRMHIIAKVKERVAN